MARVICQNCGSEVILPEHSHLTMGMTISKESKGDYVLPMRDSKGRFIKSTENSTENKESKNMMNNNNNGMNNNNNGGMNMNGFDMEMLTKLVTQAVQNQLGNVNVSQKDTETKSEYKSVAQNYMDATDGGRWAKGSKYYGKEICGFVFNPYMMRWHLQNQFEQLMNRAKRDDYNIHGLIQKDYPYMYAVNYTLEEVRKLAMLQKKDRLAFDERKRCFDLDSCKKIFADYVRHVINEMEKEERELARSNKIGKEVYIYRKKYGRINAGVVVETIENHFVVKKIARNMELEAVYAELNRILKQLTERYSGIWNYKSLYDLMRDNVAIKVPAKTIKSRDFMNCFIKSGAYYTLKQTLMFNPEFKFRNLSGRDAVLELRRELNRDSVAGYQFYAMLKEAKGIRCGHYRY